ncbi:MAG: UDP-N-acetylmuramoyl-L-alanyl-D-glutamate--2,6-diaminopimelate ligase [Sporomusaceae bacterium]|nr:UDP-N-acetylmuramoyl-L-alanyl-D-glutamate--2,6-diaminopimelate ligase [Sporomusaceae bacterium]
MAKTLQELLQHISGTVVQGETDLIIQSLAYDSRKVTPGCLFICLKGAHVNGHDFIAKAKEAGAVAVLVEEDVAVPQELTVIKTASTREAMQTAAPYFYDYPARKVRMIGVTGTNGKTTTTYLIRQILLEAGYQVGVIGTIQTLIGEKALPVKNTTPDVIDLQQLLCEMVEASMDYVVMEVSSHALAMQRVAGCEFDGAIFTNLTQDHLDYHKTLENYREAKALLFKGLGENATKDNKWAVINGDDEAGAAMLAKVKNSKVFTYSAQGKGNLQAVDIAVKARQMQFSAKGDFGSIALRLRITGLFNVYNTLAAIGAGLGENVKPAVIQSALEKFTTVPGRFELVDAGQNFSVIVDYAHTPDGLENILKTAQQISEGRIITVFGCGGDRDRTKRPIMGRLATEYSDVVIATSDNPRSEDPLAILQEIAVGIEAVLTPEKEYHMIPDRREAIGAALRLACEHDIVMIAGKGHETYQILKDKTIDFDDRQVVREILKELN